MGYIAHHAIVVTSWSKDCIKVAHEKATEIFNGLVSEIIQTKANSYFSFFVSPDGSKEGWETSEIGNKRREQFINFLSDAYKREIWNDWVEVRYGGDEPELASIVTCGENP